VCLVLCPRIDPTPKQLDLFNTQRRLLRIRRRHAILGIIAGNADHHLAILRVAGDDSPLGCPFLGIQSQLGLPIAHVVAMAGKAAVGKYRPNVAIEARHVAMVRARNADPKQPRD
jgi:hypothetical protein